MNTDPSGPPVPVPLPAATDDPRRWISPETLNVAPDLLGLPLATPQRRAMAMAVDLGVVALLSGVSGLWLVGGLLMVVLQLRSQRGGRTRKRMVVGWVFASLLALLAVQEGIARWQQRGEPTQPSRVVEADVEEAVEQAVARALDSASVPAAASVSEAASAASSPSVTSLQRRIARLETELAAAREPRPLSLRDELDRVLDAAGASFGWGFVYFSLLPAWWGGQTLGKKLFGLQIVELTGQPMTVMRCLKRYGGYAAGMATGGLGFLQLLWDPNRQGIQDRTAHTVVVDRRASPRPLPSPS